MPSTHSTPRRGSQSRSARADLLPALLAGLTLLCSVGPAVAQRRVVEQRALRGAALPFSEVVKHFFLHAQALQEQGHWSAEERDVFARSFGVAAGSVSFEQAAYVLRDATAAVPEASPEDREAISRGGEEAKALVIARGDEELENLGLLYARFLRSLEKDVGITSYVDFETRLLAVVRPTITMSWHDEEDPLGRIAIREAAFSRGVRGVIPAWEIPK